MVTADIWRLANPIYGTWCVPCGLPSPRRGHQVDLTRSEPPAGIEPATYVVQARCSTNLSYGGVRGRLVATSLPLEEEKVGLA